MAKDARAEMVKAASAAVRKNYRGNASDTAAKELELPSVWASTGSLSLDRLITGLNPGGIPIGPTMGRIVHLAGDWSTGKSLILDHVFKSVIVDHNGLAVCSETEGTRDLHFANAIGLPLDLLTIQRPDKIETMFDMFQEWHESVRKQDAEIPIIWGIDSLDSTEAGKSAEQGFSESGAWKFGGGRAEALGAALRRWAGICSRYPTTLVMLNQTRENLGVMFGPKKRTPGGNPPHFYASVEILLSAANRPGGGLVRAKTNLPDLTQEAKKRLGLAYVGDAGTVLGKYVKANITKTKLNLTFGTTCDFYIDFRRGVHKWEGLAERLMFEGYLKCGRDGASDFVMELPGAPETSVFPTKRDWLIWLKDNLDALRIGQLAGPPPADTQEQEQAVETTEETAE
jgi:recombination protein RecA